MILARWPNSTSFMNDAWANLDNSDYLWVQDDAIPGANDEWNGGVIVADS